MLNFNKIMKIFLKDIENSFISNFFSEHFYCTLMNSQAIKKPGKLLIPSCYTFCIPGN